MFVTLCVQGIFNILLYRYISKDSIRFSMLESRVRDSHPYSGTENTEYYHAHFKPQVHSDEEIFHVYECSSGLLNF